MSEALLTLDDILGELTTFTGKFPEAALRAAVLEREAITPRLLAALEDVIAKPAEYATKGDYWLHTYALHLLSQFRETKAFPVIVKFASLPSDHLDSLIAELICDGLPSFFASTYDGDLDALTRLALNRGVDEYVRGAATSAIGVLFYDKVISRDAILAVFRRFFTEMTDEADATALGCLACTIADTQLHELMPELAGAYQRNLVDEGLIDLAEVKKSMADAPETVEKKFRATHHVITDTIKEMRWWAAFKEDSTPKLGGDDKSVGKPVSVEEPPSNRPPPRPPHSITEPTHPIHRETPKVGRNDPCPCGSGKKYKKCCLSKEEGKDLKFEI